MPFAYIQMNPQDMAELKLNPGDLVEVYNDNGSTQAMVWPTPTARRNQTFMLFAYPTGAVGNAVSKGVNELIIPNYKQTWGNIRKLADAPQVTRHLSFKSRGVQGRKLTIRPDRREARPDHRASWSGVRLARAALPRLTAAAP